MTSSMSSDSVLWRRSRTRTTLTLSDDVLGEELKPLVRAPGPPEPTDPSPAEIESSEAGIFRALEEAMAGNPEKHCVVFQVYVYSVSDLNCSENSVSVDFRIKAWWKDESLATLMWDEFDVNEYWRPHFEVRNAIEMEQIYEEKNYWINWNCSYHATVAYWQRFRGTVHLSLDLHHFPFDSQTIEIHIGSSLWTSENCVFKVLHDPAAAKLMTQGLHLYDWQITSQVAVEETRVVDYGDNGNEYSVVKVSVPVDRRVGYHMNKTMSIVCMLVLASWVVFFIPADTLNDRSQISLTCILAAVAFHFVVSEDLPPISYMTILDKAILISYLFMFLTICESIAAAKVQEDYDADTAKLVDKWAIVIFSIAFAVVAVVFVLMSFRKFFREDKHRKVITQQLTHHDHAWTFNDYDVDDVLSLVPTLAARGKEDGILQMSGARLPDELPRLAPLWSALRAFEGLRHLDLSYNGLQDDAVVELAAALRGCNTLTVLHLFENRIGSTGAIALMEKGVADNVEVLTLGSNRIKLQGVVAVANRIAANRPLRKLFLSFNTVGDEGAAVLATSLTSNTTLEHMQLDNAGIGRSGAKALRRVIAKGNDTLRTLQVYNEGVPAHLIASIKSALQDDARVARAQDRCSDDGSDGEADAHK